jgi:hypothetical protein
MTTHQDLVTRLEDAASFALTEANNAGKLAHKPGVYMASIEAAAKLGHAIIEVRDLIERQAAELEAVRKDAERYRMLRHILSSHMLSFFDLEGKHSSVIDSQLDDEIRDAPMKEKP